MFVMYFIVAICKHKSADPRRREPGGGGGGSPG